MQHFFPETMENLIRLCQHAKFTISIPDKQTCCGLPYFEKGELKTAKTIGEYNLSVFKGNNLICGSPKCQGTYALKYPKIFNNTVSHNDSVTLAKNTTGLDELLSKATPLANAANIRGRYFLVRCQAALSVTAEKLAAFPNCEWLYPQLELCSCGAETCMPTTNRQQASKMALNLLEEAARAKADYIVALDDICRKHLENVAAENHISIKTLHIIDIFAQAL